MVSGCVIKIKNNINIKKNVLRGRSPLTSKAGFTLIEVVIAITLFAIFIIAFISTQGSNVRDSVNMKEELLLQKLCENKLNEILLDPPELKESLTLTPKKGNLEDMGYSDYEYSVEYKRLKIPNLNAITGEDSEKEGEADGDGGAGTGAGAGGATDGGSGDDADPNAAKESKEKQSKMFQNKVFETIRKNVEEMVWQVKVTVQHKKDNFPFSLVAFIDNKKAKVKLDL